MFRYNAHIVRLDHVLWSGQDPGCGSNAEADCVSNPQVVVT